MSLDDRVAIVTGGASGIGRGIALELGRAGANVVVADVRRDPKQGDRYDHDVSTPTDRLLAEDCDVESIFVETDTGREADVRRVIDETLEEFECLDVLVNNAGILIPGSSQDVTLDDWKRVVDVNLTGYFLTAKYAIPALRDAEHGRIVNVSSINAYFGGSGPAYASTKAGIVNLTRDLAVEVSDDGVTVNAVLPGVIKTPLQDLNDDETIQREAEKTPLPRVGEPKDVAAAVRFFASDDAEWITGANLTVDGGYLAAGH